METCVCVWVGGGVPGGEEGVGGFGTESFTAGPGLPAAPASRVGVLVRHAGVRRGRDLLEELVFFQHALGERHNAEDRVDLWGAVA